MPFIKHEEVTLPMRFLLLTMHFVIVLSITLDLPAVTKRMSGVNASNQNSQQNLLSGFSYAAMGCFGIEFISLFIGVSTFNRPLTTLNMAAHLTGFILVCLFRYLFWGLNAYITFVAIFNFVPATIEMLDLWYLTTFAYAKY